MLISMDKNRISDEEFFKKYEAYEKGSWEDFIKRYSSTEKELKETIAYLIRHREMMGEVELKKLEAEAQSLLDKLKETNLGRPKLPHNRRALRSLSRML
jgi:hypothetical protein